MISVGKLYRISSRFKYLRVAVHLDENHSEPPTAQDLVKNVPFLVLDWNMSDNDTFYKVKGLIGDQVGYFNLNPEEIEEITV